MGLLRRGRGESPLLPSCVPTPHALPRGGHIAAHCWLLSTLCTSIFVSFSSLLISLIPTHPVPAWLIASPQPHVDRGQRLAGGVAGRGRGGSRQVHPSQRPPPRRPQGRLLRRPGVPSLHGHRGRRRRGARVAASAASNAGERPGGRPPVAHDPAPRRLWSEAAWREAATCFSSQFIFVVHPPPGHAFLTLFFSPSSAPLVGVPGRVLPGCVPWAPKVEEARLEFLRSLTRKHRAKDPTAGKANSGRSAGGGGGGSVGAGAGPKAGGAGGSGFPSFFKGWGLGRSSTGGDDKAAAADAAAAAASLGVADDGSGVDPLAEALAVEHVSDDDDGSEEDDDEEEEGAVDPAVEAALEAYSAAVVDHNTLAAQAQALEAREAGRRAVVEQVPLACAVLVRALALAFVVARVVCPRCARARPLASSCHELCLSSDAPLRPLFSCLTVADPPPPCVVRVSPAILPRRWRTFGSSCFACGPPWCPWTWPSSASGGSSRPLTRPVHPPHPTHPQLRQQPRPPHPARGLSSSRQRAPRSRRLSRPRPRLLGWQRR